MGYAYVKKRAVYFLGALCVLGTSQLKNSSSPCVRYKQCIFVTPISVVL